MSDLYERIERYENSRLSWIVPLTLNAVLFAVALWFDVTVWALIHAFLLGMGTLGCWRNWR